jgi:hypothetical protein
MNLLSASKFDFKALSFFDFLFNFVDFVSQLA